MSLPGRVSGPGILRPLARNQVSEWIPYMTVSHVKSTRVDREADGDLMVPVTWPVPPSSVFFQQRVAFCFSALHFLEGLSCLA